MGKRYICEVKRDHKNNEIELVRSNDFEYGSSASEGAIKFLNNHEMNRYFNRNCVSEDELQNNGNSLFMFLFFLLLLIFLVTLICQMFNKSGINVDSTVGKTTFGRFSF